MKLNHFIISVLCLAMAGCSQDAPDFLTSNPAKKSESHKVSLQEALRRSTPFTAGLNVGQRTRAFDMSEIESVSYQTLAPKTRGSEEDTVFYLVNFKDSKGFMLLSADDRMMPVYAMADEGSLDLNDTTFNEGLHIFYDMAQQDAAALQSSSLNLPPLKPDSSSLNIDPFNYNFDRIRPPYFSKNLREITQYAPFNKYCYRADGTQALVAGCGPVAVAGILAYYHKPTSIEGRRINWNAIDKNIENDDFYYLIAALGKDKYLKCTYNDSTTSSKYNRFYPTFTGFGFKNTDYVPFEKYEASSALEKGPIFIYAPNVKKGAHVWIIDGYIRYGYAHAVTNIPENNPLSFFFHCCWGWGGKGNGYYYYSSDGKMGGNASRFDDDDRGTNSSYTYRNLKMMTGFDK